MGVIQACFVGHRKDGIKTGHFPPVRTQVTMPMKEDLFINQQRLTFEAENSGRELVL